MTRYWFMRNDPSSTDFFWEELQAGRLRQGWGYRPEHDLRIIAEAIRRSEALTEEQRKTWRGNRRMLETEPDAISVGDVIISPHVPRRGVWSLSRVEGKYRYEMPPGQGDYGHVLPVQLVSPRPVNPYEESVSARLRQSLRNLSRLWNIDYLGADIEAILKALEEGAPGDSIRLEQRLRGIMDSLEQSGWDAFVRHFHGNEFEVPCVEMLKRIFGEGEVEHTGGRLERGADAICTYEDPLGLEHRVAVQIKMWDWDAASLRPLEQIRQAYDSYEGITSGVILSRSEAGTKEFEEARLALERELKIPVRVIFRSSLLRLFMVHLPELIAATAK